MIALITLVLFLITYFFVELYIPHLSKSETNSISRLRVFISTTTYNFYLQMYSRRIIVF